MSLENNELIRNEYAHLGVLYFNSAYFGPSPYRAKQKIANATFKELDPSFFPYNTWMGIAERVREQFSKILSCSADNISHATSTSDIHNIIAQGYPFKSGDVIAVMENEYPSNVLPWMMAQKHGRAQLEFIAANSFTLDKLKKNLPHKTKIFNLSYVAFDTGRKAELLEIGKYLKERDIFFVVDATQALGGLKITEEELSYIDVLSVSSYKWMLGPYGHAFGYYSDKAIKTIDYFNTSWTKSPNSKHPNNLIDYTIETLAGARKFDRGQVSNMLINACLEAGLEFLYELGLDKIQDYNQGLRDYFLDHFPAKKFELVTPRDSMGNILSLKMKTGNPLELEEELKFNNIDVSVREGKVRLSFHLFNNKDQIDTLIKALDI